MKDKLLEKQGAIMQNKSVLDIIKENYAKIFSAERKVADFILEHPRETINSNISELAKQIGVSDSTVIRMCHHLGIKGYYQLRLMLAKEIGRFEEQEEEIRLQSEANPMSTILKSYAESLIAIGDNNDTKEISTSVDLIKNCREAHILAVGNSTPLALYMGFRLGRLGIKCTYGISPDYFMNQVNLADEGDIIIAISQSGSSRQVIKGVELAKEKGLKVIAITGYRESSLSKLSDHLVISNGRKESFNYYRNFAHLKETAVIDVLLDLLTNWEIIKQKDADKPEMILLEYKY